MEMENFMYTLDDDIFDLDYYDSAFDYSDESASTGSNESDIENNPYTQCSYMKKSSKLHGGKKVQQRKAANMRERRRMKSINDAFDCLRKCIPTSESVERKLSKVDTLKLAMRYISYLADVIKTTDELTSNSQYSQSERSQEKVILRCHYSENDMDGGNPNVLLGHSLTWRDEKRERSGPKDNKLTAKIWFPDFANDNDLINLSSYTTDYSKVT